MPPVPQSTTVSGLKRLNAPLVAFKHKKLIYNEVISKITDFISNVQFGFLKNRSTLQQLLIFVNEIFTCGTQSDAVYFDIRKAFDSVCHNQLLVKLWSAGISGQLWSWFRSYILIRQIPVRCH